MKFGVVTFPGSNCDNDMHYVLGEIMNENVVSIWHKDRNLQNVDMVILPGGFSYGDYLRSGAIAKFSPIMEEVFSHAKRGGYVFGICNGFQVLTECGLLDGALLHNNNQKFICKNVNILPVSNVSPITKGLSKNESLLIPIAHGEGRYYADNSTIKNLEDSDQIIFKYCNSDCLIDDENNPNGSLKNIAGVTNKSMNVFGMMPHPERAADKTLNNSDGKKIFNSILNYCK
jgi:phosphoribosylformylglycinamidine synthase I